jgi:hypothetical protein
MDAKLDSFMATLPGVRPSFSTIATMTGLRAYNWPKVSL